MFGAAHREESYCAIKYSEQASGFYYVTTIKQLKCIRLSKPV